MPQLSLPPCASGRYWRITPGDTLYLIATEARTTVDALLSLNPGLDPYNLPLDHYICLPAAEPPCASGLYWRVAPGDTIYGIAQSTGFSMTAILAVNPGLDPDNLQVGQNICLPE